MRTGKEIGDNFCLRIVAGGLDGNPQLWSVLDTVHSAEFIAVHKVFLCRVLLRGHCHVWSSLVEFSDVALCGVTLCLSIVFHRKREISPICASVCICVSAIECAQAFRRARASCVYVCVGVGWGGVGG